MTIEEAKAFIDECTARLKGPMSNLERALTVADRKDAQSWLKREQESESALVRSFNQPSRLGR